MKFERSIIRIEGSQYVALPPGVFKEVKKVIMDVQFIRNDSSLTIRLYPKKEDNNGTEEKTVTVKIPVDKTKKAKQ